MKTLIVNGHSDFKNSKVNKYLINSISELDIDILNVQELYEEHKFDLTLEQNRLIKYDNIIFEFPLYWYSVPYVLKRYIDDVFTSGYAFSNGGDKLKGKNFSVVVTAGGPEVSYNPGEYNNNHLSVYLKPLEQMASLSGMNYKRALYIYDANRFSDNIDSLDEVAKKYKEYLLDLK